MTKDVASANVDRSYSLAATSIAIFTFVLFFLHPQVGSGAVNALLFQATLIVMGLATFSFACASFYYYGTSLGDRLDDARQAPSSRRGDHCWLLGCVLLFLAPSLVLFSIGLRVVASAWLMLWLGFVLFVIRYFPRVRIAWKDSGPPESERPA